MLFRSAVAAAIDGDEIRSRGQRLEALVARDRGDLASAESDLRRALAVVEKGLGAESNPVTELRLDLADVLLRAGQRDEARVLIERVHTNVYTKFMLDSPPCVQFETLAAKLDVKTTLSERRRAADPG